MSTLPNRTAETQRTPQYRTGQRRGFARPGAAQMVIGAVGLIIESLGPLFYAAINRPHEFDVFLTGAPAFAVFAVTALFGILYVIGFFRYTKSKGYSGWLGLLLLFCNLPGLLILLMLPDRR